MDFDVNALVNGGIAGAAVWGAIRAEIRFLWRTVRELKAELREVRRKLELKNSCN